MVHTLKILPYHFEDIAYGYKKFEIRKKDRDFKDGDVIALNEWIEPYTENGEQRGGYTGRFILARIAAIYEYPEYLRDGYVILALKEFNANLNKIYR